jgi:hypothetical protein
MSFKTRWPITASSLTCQSEVEAGASRCYAAGSKLYLRSVVWFVCPALCATAGCCEGNSDELRPRDMVSIWQLLPMGRGRRLNNWSEYGESSLGQGAHREPQVYRATCEVFCGLSCSEKLCSGASSARIFKHGLVC